VKNFYDEEERIIRNEPLQVREINGHREVDFYLIDVIEDVKDYVDFLREIEMCNKGDLITVHINCYGGAVDVSLNIYDSLRNSDADVKISIEGPCCSSASMIALAGDMWSVSKHASIMIHSWSEGLYGKWHEILASIDFTKKSYEKHFQEIYKNFMTDEEIKNCLEGKDYYFDSDEIMKRLQSFTKEEDEREKKINEIADKFSSMAEKEINKFLNSKGKKK